MYNSRMAQTHVFPFTVQWQGTTTTAEYARDAETTAADHPVLATSSAPAYKGNPTRWNPEELLGAALANCHMLTFLALAQKAQIDVRSYTDHATAVLEMADGFMRVTKITLAPTITVAAGADEGNVKTLFEKAHKYCFVANSIRSHVEMQPTITFA